MCGWHQWVRADGVRGLSSGGAGGADGVGVLSTEVEQVELMVLEF